MSKIPTHLVKQVLTKTTDTDFLHSLSDHPDDSLVSLIIGNPHAGHHTLDKLHVRFPIEVAKHPNTSTETLNSIVDKWSNTKVSDESYTNLLKAVYNMSRTEPRDQPHTNLLPSTRSQINLIGNQHLADLNTYVDSWRAIPGSVLKNPPSNYGVHFINQSLLRHLIGHKFLSDGTWRRPDGTWETSSGQEILRRGQDGQLVYRQK